MTVSASHGRWWSISARTRGWACRTLFCPPHYHELTELEGKIAGVKNFSITVQEHGEDIIFLRRIVRGGTQKSLGNPGCPAGGDCRTR